MSNFNKLTQAFTIFAKYCKDGMLEKGIVGADHDIIYCYISNEKLTPESEDGQKLQDLGFKPHEAGNWSLSV